MRQGIHPDYVEATVHCSCGNTFVTRSTTDTLHVELCNKCHPFYTGQQKFVDTGGRVQRFSDKFGGAAETVMKREQAEKEARQKAHEEALATGRAAREAKEREDAEKARKAALRAPRVDAVAEAAEPEAPVETEAAAETEAPAEDSAE
jgi:large subunit ribosomal protein L31